VAAWQRAPPQTLGRSTCSGVQRLRLAGGPRAQVLANKVRDKRLAKRELKIKLNWILRKKARGF
jgi:hypothetical protein